MKKNKFLVFIIIFLLLMCLTISGVAGFVIFRSMQKDQNWFNDCIETYEVTNKSVSFIKKGEVRDSVSQLGIKTSSLDKPYNKTLNKGPLLFIKTFNENEVYINFNYFEKLKVTNVTGDKMEKTRIGTYKELEFKELTPREVSEFLIRSGVIQTYQHLGATICLSNEIENQNIYKASYQAEHELCTNECFVLKYEFQIHIDKKTGDIDVLK
ncbi:hypothetical protein GF362_06010 [Candidatus Dojkabacteria bacterium]|nr:hypothetical protein [Candidatus Dojkabacteria bacterium]